MEVGMLSEIPEEQVVRNGVQASGIGRVGPEDDQWVMMIGETNEDSDCEVVHEVCGVSYHNLLVDTGASTTVLKHGAFEAPVIPQARTFQLRGIGGEEIKHYGKQQTTVTLPSPDLPLPS